MDVMPVLGYLSPPAVALAWFHGHLGIGSAIGISERDVRSYIRKRRAARARGCPWTSGLASRPAIRAGATTYADLRWPPGTLRETLVRLGSIVGNGDLPPSSPAYSGDSRAAGSCSSSDRASEQRSFSLRRAPTCHRTLDAFHRVTPQRAGTHGQDLASLTPRRSRPHSLRAILDAPLFWRGAA